MTTILMTFFQVLQRNMLMFITYPLSTLFVTRQDLNTAALLFITKSPFLVILLIYLHMVPISLENTSLMKLKK